MGPNLPNGTLVIVNSSSRSGRQKPSKLLVDREVDIYLWPELSGCLFGLLGSNGVGEE